MRRSVMLALVAGLLLALEACNFGFPDPLNPILVQRKPVEVQPVQPRIKIPVQAEYYYHQLVEHDPRLDAAARDFARFLDAGGLPDRDVAERALRLHGIVEPIHDVVTASTSQELDKILWDDANHANARWSYAPTARGMVGILVYAFPVNLDYVPRSATELKLAGTFDPTKSAPRIKIDFKEPVPVTSDGDAFHADYACKREQMGVHLISIEVTDPKRIFMPLAFFPVYCGVDAPSTLVGEPALNVDVPDDRFASRLVEIIDRERAAAKLPAMHWNPRLLDVTTTMLADHSRRVYSDPNWHLHKALLKNPFVEFTEFHVASLGGAVTRIIDDEVQKQKYLDGHNTDIAVAVKKDTTGYFVVVGYLKVPNIQDVPSVQPIISARIKALKNRQYRVVPAADRGIREAWWLSTVATVYARELATGWSFDTLHSRDAIFFHTTGITADIAVDLDNFSLEATIAKKEFWVYGVGIAQAPQDSAFAGLIFVVVLYRPLPPSLAGLMREN